VAGVDHNGTVLDILVQNGRNTAAARRFFRKLDKTTASVPRVVITDKLRSYGAALREVMPAVLHRFHKGLNNRTENSHQPTRQRERAMKGLRSVARAPRFLAAFSYISPHVRPRRHLFTAFDYRNETKSRFTVWKQITGTTTVPQAA
jgi:putative transposase